MYTNIEDQGKESASLLVRYKKPLIFVVSAAAIIAVVLVIFFVLMDNTGNDSDTPAKQEFTFDSIFNSSLSPKSFSLQWGGNGQFYIYQNTTVSRDYLKFDLASRTPSLFINATVLAEVIPSYSSYVISPDSQYLLFSVNATSVWRHSILASYLVYSVATNSVTSLVQGNPLLQNVIWNPVTRHVAYVRDFNIYIVDSTTQAEPISVTADGDADGGILNGIQSWVYEEEVFSDYNAMWWSDDGTMLAYLRFNESQVPIFEYTYYTDSSYPTQIPLRYPKAGYTNPQVRLYVYNLTSGSSTEFPYLEYGTGDLWEYIYSVQWRQDNSLWVQQLNRYQNVSTTLAISPSAQTGTWVTEVAANATTSKWISVSWFTFCTIEGSLYNFIRLPNNDHYHLAYVHESDGVWTTTFLTQGNFDVISISGCSPDGRVFFTSTKPGDDLVGPTLQLVHTVTLSGVLARVWSGDGVFSANLSPLGDFLQLNYQGPDVPRSHLLSSDGTFNLTLEDNQRYADIIAQYDLPEKTFTTVRGAGGETLNAYYKKPKNAKSGHPLVIDVYAGPATQRVRQVHDVAGLDAFLCSQGYVIAALDGRGTGNRGLAFMQATYRQLGLLEVSDQRAGAKDLAEKISAVDTSRVGIWGWSFGGFMAAHGSADTSAIDGFKFKAAVSVAPVTDWRLYDSVYTERYMSTPQDNPTGYNATSVNQHASTIASNTLLLMHGLADDNVHFQNSAEFVSALIAGDVQFDTMYYPNNNHAINSGNARRYLYEKMLAFLNRNL